MNLVLTISKRTSIYYQEDTGKIILKKTVIYGENSYFCLLQVLRLLEAPLAEGTAGCLSGSFPMTSIFSFRSFGHFLSIWCGFGVSFCDVCLFFPSVESRSMLAFQC